MKHIYKIFLIIFLISCKNQVPTNTVKIPDYTPEIVQDSFQEDELGMIEISKTTVIGKTPDYALPKDRYEWKGVFVEGRTVVLSPYKIAKVETTYKLWKEVKDWAIQNGYKFKNPGKKGSKEKGEPNEISTELEPVTRVSWRDAIIWCNAYTAYTASPKGNTEQCVYRKSVNEPTVLKDSNNEKDCDSVFFDQTKKGFRLPTEAEWELAARYQGNDQDNGDKYGNIYLTRLDSAAGAKKPIGFPEVEKGSYTWLELYEELKSVAVFDKWWDGSGYQEQSPSVIKTAEVASKKANTIGAFDMSGNVWEWCFDIHTKIEKGECKNPIGTSSTSMKRIVRGGSWLTKTPHLTTGHRSALTPDNIQSLLGFRLARYQ